jgi:hypothetical protein
LILFWESVTADVRALFKTKNRRKRRANSEKGGVILINFTLRTTTLHL